MIKKDNLFSAKSGFKGEITLFEDKQYWTKTKLDLAIGFLLCL